MPSRVGQKEGIEALIVARPKMIEFRPFSVLVLIVTASALRFRQHLDDFVPHLSPALHAMCATDQLSSGQCIP